MLIHPCGKCGEANDAFTANRHQCHRNLGPRMKGPGFNMRWKLNEFMAWGVSAKIASADPAGEIARSISPNPVKLVRECIAYDRRATGRLAE